MVESRAFLWLSRIGLTLEWLALGVWVGGLVVLVAAVIPAVFNTFGGQDSGGLFLTKAFEGFNRAVMAAMAVMIAGVGWRRWVQHPAMSPTALEMVLLGAMVLIAGVIIGVLHPQAAALQAEAFALKDETARKAALGAFFKLHMPVRALYMVNLCLGIALMGLRVNHTLQTLRVNKGQA
ncbi:MAG: hypothetical protein IT389_11655 [Nitrospira sp.]|nr:hypothetical protein [Nitrospira sp.]